MSLPHGLRAFRHRSFRLFFLGQGISQLGTWLQLIATSWLIYRLTGSALYLGLASFALQVPFLVLAPVAGVWVDRLSKRTVLRITNSIAFAQSLAMLVLVASGHIEPWHLVAGNLVLGVVNAFDSPARQAFLIELVEGRADLPNAIAFQSMLMNGARFVGPMIGGAVIALAGEVWGFALNSASYLSILAALALMRVQLRAPQGGPEGWLTGLAAGFRWAYGFLPSRSALLLLAAVSFGVQPLQALAPFFARDVFGGNSQTLGWLIGAGGCGAVSAMLYLALRPTVRGLMTVVGWAGAAAGTAVIAFAWNTQFWLALGLVYVSGMGMMLTAGSINTVLQTIVEDRLRARVAAIYVMSFLGMSPLGALGAGWAAQYVGPPAALALGGALSLCASLAYLARLPGLRRELRPLYVRLGIAPQADQRAV
ncbi:MAG: MFS transporter [Betaproteobacteria bacterium]|nr:MFS transporter [Betaproteobacteria bacterium]